MSLVFNNPHYGDRSGDTYICVRQDGLYIGSMRRPYTWAGWVWYPRESRTDEPVMLGRDTHAAKVKLREMLS